MSGFLFALETIAPFARAQISIYANRAAMALQHAHGTGSFSKFIQAARGPTPKIVTRGVQAFTLYTTAIQIKDTKNDVDEGKSTTLQAFLGSGAAIAGCYSGLGAGTQVAAFCWAGASSVMTKVKYELGGVTAIKDRNNQIDYLNSVAAIGFTQLSNGNLAAGASLFNGLVTAGLSATHDKNLQVMKTIIEPANIWTVISAAGDRIKNAEIDLVIAENNKIFGTCFDFTA